MNTFRYSLIVLTSLLALFFTACREDDPPELSDEADIVSFMIAKNQNPSLTKDYAGVIDQPAQHIALYFEDEEYSGLLTPTIGVSPGAVVSPASGVAVSFASPVTYTITAPSGVKKNYTVSLSYPGGEPLVTGVRINNIPCPVDQASGRYFFSVAPGGTSAVRVFCIGQNTAEFTVGGVTASNNSVVTIPDFAAGTTLEIIPRSKSGKTGTPVQLVLTSLPLVVVEAQGTIVNNPKTECHIALIDPAGKTNDSLYYFPAHRAGIEIRGGKAQEYPKKSYSLEFRMPTGTEEVPDGTRLLGLRDDGDWILDAMYIDHARMRNRLSTDIWTAINKVPHFSKEPKAVNGTHGAFVELFINDNYQGLYCLTERIDRKQLQLNKKQGYCYKASEWSPSTEFVNGDAAYNNKMNDWDGWELEYQAENGMASSPQVKWEPLRNFIRYTVMSGNADFMTNIPQRMDLANLADYLLFINAIGADDNSGKNIYFSFYGTGWEKFFITPWDLDASWGRKSDGTLLDLRSGDFIGVTGIPGVNSRYCRPNAFFMRMTALNPAGFRSLLKSRWLELRQGELSMTSLSQRMDTYRQQLLTSGAYDREKQKWPDNISPLDDETQYMLSWIENRISQVDQYLLEFR